MHITKLPKPRAYPQKKDHQQSFAINIAARIHPKVKIEENAKIFFTEDCLIVPSPPTKTVAQVIKLSCEDRLKDTIIRGIIFCQQARSQMKFQDNF